MNPKELIINKRQSLKLFCILKLKLVLCRNLIKQILRQFWMNAVKCCLLPTALMKHLKFGTVQIWDFFSNPKVDKWLRTLETN